MAVIVSLVWPKKFEKCHSVTLKSLIQHHPHFTVETLPVGGRVGGWVARAVGLAHAFVRCVTRLPWQKWG